MSSFTIDCTGLACPQPVIQTKKMVESEAPETFVVVVDNKAALENVSRFLASNGYTPSTQEESGVWRITATAVTAGDDPAQKIARENPAQKTKAASQDKSGEDLKTVVLIVSPVIGTGDDELGGRLMKNFLATLPELGDSLWRVILLNGGVTLATADSHVIGELQTLEQAGVTILVCGTCLEHFHLLSLKAVGQTTNMLDVVTSLQLAGKVIRV